MTDKELKAEKKRLYAILEGANIPERKRDSIEGVIENIATLRLKLLEALETMKTEPLIVDYDNGGGQSGTRINPIYKCYGDLFRVYLAGLDKFLSLLPEEQAAPIRSDSISVLDKVRNMKKGTA